MIWFEVQTFLTSRRWFITPALALLLTYISFMSLKDFSMVSLGYNQWDVLLGIFNSPVIVSVFLPITFFYLISDLSVKDLNGWGIFTWSRVASRWQWWAGKIGAVFVISVVFNGVIWTISVFVSLLIAPISYHWSNLAAVSGFHYSGGISVRQLYVAPPVVFIEIFLLVTFGLFALGSVIVVLSFVTRHAIIGWILGASISLISYGIWMLKPKYSVYAPTLQLLLGGHSGFYNGTSSIPSFFTIEWSLGVEIIVVVVFFAYGLISVRKQNL